MNPYFIFGVGFGGMFMLAKTNVRIFGNYMDWIRLQLLLWHVCCLSHPATRYLIWQSTLAGFLSMHYVYLLTDYRLMDETAAQFYKKVMFFDVKTTRTMHLALDMAVHGTPVVYAYCMLPTAGKAPPFLWLFTGIPHAVYARVLTGSWSLVSTKEYGGDDWMVVVCVLLGHWTAYATFCA
jgi:hypothetical protein